MTYFLQKFGRCNQCSQLQMCSHAATTPPMRASVTRARQHVRTSSTQDLQQVQSEPPLVSLPHFIEMRHVHEQRVPGSRGRGRSAARAMRSSDFGRRLTSITVQSWYALKTMRRAKLLLGAARLLGRGAAGLTNGCVGRHCAAIDDGWPGLPSGKGLCVALLRGGQTSVEQPVAHELAGVVGQLHGVPPVAEQPPQIFNIQSRRFWRSEGTLAVPAVNRLLRGLPPIFVYEPERSSTRPR